MHTEGCALPSLFPCIIHGTVHSKPLLEVCLREGAVMIRTLVVESDILSDQCYELLCFILRDFADLWHGWITRAFHRQDRLARKCTRSDANERHTHPLTRTVRHRSLHGPIKINVSVSRSVSVSVSVHMESGTVYFYFLSLYRIRVCIRRSRIAP